MANVFVDKSSFEVSGMITYPPWKTDYVLCGVGGVDMFRDADTKAKTQTDAHGRWAIAVGIGELVRV